MGVKITSHRELGVYQRAFEAAMRIFELSKGFPRDETYSLADQVRRSSRSVCANLTEAWRKRRYEAAFVSKLNDAETKADETTTWLEFAERCGYLDSEPAQQLRAGYDDILRTIVGMINHPEQWVFPSGLERRNR